MSAPKTIAIQVGNATRQVVAPASWNDLDEKTLHLYYNTLFTTKNDEFTNAAFTSVKLISLTKSILGINDAFLLRWEMDCIKGDPEHGEIVFLSELKAVMVAALDGLFTIDENDETGTRYACRLNLTRNPYPKLANTEKDAKGKAKKTTWYYAPDDGLSNITIYELATTFTYFEQYLATNDESWAHKLIGALYRPSKPITKHNVESAYEGDRRQPLRKHEKKVAERAALAATLPALVRRLILFWFAGCRQGIIERYGKVFKRGGNEKPGYGWGGVLLAVAGGPTGLEAIADQHYTNALTWLSMKEDEREAMEEQMAEAKRRK